MPALARAILHTVRRGNEVGREEPCGVRSSFTVLALKSTVSIRVDVHPDARRTHAHETHRAEGRCTFPVPIRGLTSSHRPTPLACPGSGEWRSGHETARQRTRPIGLWRHERIPTKEDTSRLMSIRSHLTLSTTPYQCDTLTRSLPIAPPLPLASSKLFLSAAGTSLKS